MTIVSLHRLYFLFTLSYISLGPAARQGGTTLLVVYFLFVLIYCHKISAWYPIRSLFAFTSIGLFYVILSYFDVLPDAWTKYYASSMIPRQAFYIPTFCPMVLAARAFWIHAFKDDKIALYCRISLIPLILITPFINKHLAGSLYYTGEKAFLFTGFMNSFTFLFFCASYLIMVKYRKKAWYLVPIVVAAGLIDSKNTQTQIIICCLFIFTFIRVKKITFKVMFPFVALLSMYLITIAPIIATSHQNIAHRGFMWLDAINGFLDTGGLGIGFGKEIVTNYYYYLENRTPAKFNEIMVEGIHNSFISMFFRLGVLGGISFLWFYMVSCFPRVPQNSLLFRHTALTIVIASISTFVNVGIESPMALIGIVQCLGYVLACNHVFGIQIVQKTSSRI